MYLCSFRVVWIKSLKAVDIRSSHLPILQHLGYTVLVDFEKANTINGKKHLEWSLRWDGSKRREHSKIHQPFHKVPCPPPCHSFKNHGLISTPPTYIWWYFGFFLCIILFSPSLPLTSAYFIWFWNILNKYAFKILFYLIMNCLFWCTILDAWGWCTGTTQREGMGNTGIPVADSFRYLAKLIQYCNI